jgi:hypothetical protein
MLLTDTRGETLPCKLVAYELTTTLRLYAEDLRVRSTNLLLNSAVSADVYPTSSKMIICDATRGLQNGV